MVTGLSEPDHCGYSSLTLFLKVATFLITIPDTLFSELMNFTEAGSRTEAVQVAVETYVRRAKLEQLRALRGKLDITGTEAMDEADIREQHEQLGLGRL